MFKVLRASRALPELQVLLEPQVLLAHREQQVLLELQVPLVRKE